VLEELVDRVALPWITLKTPLADRLHEAVSPKRTDTEGSRSDGFKITALPVAIAFAVIHRAP